MLIQSLHLTIFVLITIVEEQVHNREYHEMNPLDSPYLLQTHILNNIDYTENTMR